MQRMDDYDYAFKFILVGDSGVGKSTLIERYIKKRFTRMADVTIGVEFQCNVIEIDGKRVRIEIWDTAGQERFRSITKAYFRDAIATLIVYDISYRNSFVHIPDWIKILDEDINTDYLFKVLIGNKTDKSVDRHISFDEGKSMAKKFNLLFYETSARFDDKITDIFIDIAKLIKKEYDNGNIQVEKRQGIKISKNLIQKRKKKKTMCCFNNF